uniref:Iff101 n=1 Tax=Candida metapsilosis TaxID=273372 RepID=A0A4Y5MV25_9ASCO|nr:Iff101 [Candida metapsilosis]
MNILLKFHLAVWLLVATALAKDIQSGTIVDWGTQNVGYGDIHIFSKAIWSIINNAASNFHGNIQIDKAGGLFVSVVNPKITLSATLMDLKYGFVNNGVVSFNAIKGYSNYLFKIMGNKFENNGDLFYSASGKGSAMSGIMSTDWHNNGHIQVYQEMKSDSYTYLGYDGKTAVNNGQVCFTNVNFKQRASILGAGCFTAQEKSSFYFMNTNLKISEDQIFYFANGESSIMAVGSTSNPQTFHVRGFGTTNGVANKIGLTAKLYNPTPGKSPFAYNARDGILTLYVGLYSQNFEIGTGYDYTKFQIVSDNSRGLPGIYLGAVQYNGPPPNPGMPPECKPCKAIPGIPGIDQPPATSYSIDTTTTLPKPTDEPTEVPEITTTQSSTTKKQPNIKTVTVQVTRTITETNYVTETDYIS